MAGNFIGAYSPQPVSTGGGGTWGLITGNVEDQTDLVTYIDDQLDGISDKLFTQPSAGTSWIIVHGRPEKVNLAFFNAVGEREYPTEDHSAVGQVSVEFATSEVHTAILPGNGASASLRDQQVISILASDLNDDLGKIDISLAKTFVITMDEDLTSDINFANTVTECLPLRLKFIKGATPHTADVDPANFKDSTTAVHPSPMLLASANTEDVFDYLGSVTSGKMVLMGFVLGG